MRNGINVDTLTSADIVEIVKCGGYILEVFEGFFCHNLKYNPNTVFVTDMFEKRDHNPENLVFRHLPVKEKIENPYKNNRLEETIRMRNGIKIDILTSADIVEIVKCGGIILELFEGFFCHNLEHNPKTVFVTDMFEKRDLFKSQGKDLLQNLAKKIGLSVYGGNIRKHRNEEYKCVIETWTKENFDERVKGWFLLKDGFSIVKLEDDEGTDDYDKAKSVNTMPSHCGSYILLHRKRLMKNVISKIGGFYKNSIYYHDTDSLFIHKKYGLTWLIMDS